MLGRTIACVIPAHTLLSGICTTSSPIFANRIPSSSHSGLMLFLRTSTHSDTPDLSGARTPCVFCADLMPLCIARGVAFASVQTSCAIAPAFSIPLAPRLTAPLTAGTARGRAPLIVAQIPAHLAISPKVASDHFCMIGSSAPNAPPILTPFAMLLSIGAHLIAVAPSFAVGMRAVVAILPTTSPTFAPAE